MKSGKQNAILSLTLLCAALASAQSNGGGRIAGHVVDPQSRPISGAVVVLNEPGRILRSTTDSEGHFDFTADVKDADVRVEIAGFAPRTVHVSAGGDAEIKLSPATVTQNVVVSVTRSDVPAEAMASSVRVLPSEQLANSAGVTLDDKLRQVPGFELFRRSSARVSNPTNQGVSLRGLGSTAASRTLVLSDLIPVNDPFGGWIHWDETPQLLIQQVEVVRGGGSDLYGSSAIGGVVDFEKRPPTLAAGELQLQYGAENTPQASLVETISHGPWHGLIAGDFFRTDGYILVAPGLRGTIDTPSNVHYQNANVEVERTFGSRGSAFLGGNMMNEARANGTVVQNNATRLWRYNAGVDWNTSTTSALKIRAYGTTEHYRQSFSSTASDRNSETLTRLQSVPTGALGGSAQWMQSVAAHFTFVAGADIQDIRAADVENTFFKVPTGYVDTTARQRETGVYGEGILQYAKWTITGSLRYDNFRNLDAQQWTLSHSTLTHLPIADRSENVADPRIGVVRRVTSNLSLTASAFRAFRSPAMNELYRTGQVGQQITLANPELRSERATGWETGVQLAQPSRNAVVRASYFWTEVNRPVTALTLSQTPATTTLQRENLGQIRSRGVSVDYEAAPLPWLFFTGGYQYARATVTRFDPNPALVGNWIPQVPRNTAAAQVTVTRHRWGALSIQARGTGHQFDDDQNHFPLHSFFRFDAFASHEITRYLEVFIAGENLFDRTIEVGRTPILTLGTPRLVQGGIRIRWKDEGSH
jgi:outer membrane receptor protein involved in Fe transport